MRIAGLLVLVICAVLALLPRPPLDNSLEALLAGDDPEFATYRAFQASFGADEVVVVRLQGGSVPLRLSYAAEVEALFAADPTLTQVVGPTTAYPDAVAVLRDPELYSSETEAALGATFLGPLGRQLGLLDLKGESAQVYGFGPICPPQARMPLYDALEALRRKAATEGLVLRTAGPPLLNLALDRAGRAVEQQALPLLVLVTVLFLLWASKSGLLVGAVLVPLALAVLGAEGLFGYFGGQNNLVVNVAKPLILVLVLAAAIHLAAAFEPGPHRLQAAWAASKKKAPGISLALLTTAVGFGSLAGSSVRPIRDFGLVAALGCLLGILLVLLGLPLLLFGKRSFREPRADRLAEVLVSWSLARRRVVIAGALMVMSAGGAALPFLASEPHAIRYFPKSDPLRQDHEAMERAGLGLATMEWVLTIDPWSRLDSVDLLVQQVSALPEVRAVIGLPVFLREARWQVDQQEGFPTADQVALFRPQVEIQARGFLADDLLRISILVGTLDAPTLEQLAQNLRNQAKAAGLDSVVTGNYGLLMNAQRSILTTLHQSLWTTLVLMQLVLILALGLRNGLLALLPNLFPVCLGFGLMKLMAIPLDLGTSMVAAVTLGMAVDNTLHFGLAWKKFGAVGAAQSVGGAMTLGAFVVAAGFFALVPSSFGPTWRFGFLVGVAMLTGLWADLCFWPALLGRGRIEDPRPFR